MKNTHIEQEIPALIFPKVRNLLNTDYKDKVWCKVLFSQNRSTLLSIYWILFLPLLIFLVASCRKVYQLHDEIQSETITLFGFIYPDSVRVQVMRLAPLKPSGFESEFVVSDILVCLLQNNSIIDTLYTDNGIDFSLSGSPTLVPGIPYSIQVIRDKRVLIYSDNVMIPDPILIDTLIDRQPDRIEFNAIINNIPSRYLKVEVNMFTSIKIGRTYEHNIPLFADNECRLNFRSPIKTECLTIYGIDTLKIGVLNSFVQNIPSDSICFSLYTVDEWYFKYYKSLLQPLDVELGTQEPIINQGNVHGGFGYFCASNEIVYKVQK